MFSLFTGLHLWQSRRDPHQAASIHGFQIHAETGISVEDCAPGWADLLGPLLGPADSGSGSIVRLLREAPALLFPGSRLADEAACHPVQAQGPCHLSAVGGHRMAARQSPEQIHLQPSSQTL